MTLLDCPDCEKKVSDAVTYCPHCGYKFSLGEITKLKKQQNQNKVISFIVVGIVLFFLFRLCSGGDTTPESKIAWDQKDNSLNAWTHSIMYAEKNLKSPSSAKFPMGYKDYVQRNGTTYTISAYVDSENSFGAMIRTHFNATLKEVSEDKWEMISFEFVE